MGSSDPVLTLLKDFSFSAVRLPRTDLRPLLVLQKDDNDLIVLGELRKLFLPGSVPLPKASRDKQASFINGKRTRELKLGVGLSLLSNIIGAMTGQNLKLDLAYKRARNITYEFDDVKMSDVDQIDLSSYLAAASIAPGLGAIVEKLRANRLYVVTAVVKSRKFTTVAHAESGVGVAVDVPVIQGAVGGSVNVSSSGTTDSKVSYEGPEPLVFGVQAAQIEFKNGQLKGLKQIAQHDAAVRGEARRPAFSLLQTDAPFVKISTGSPARPASKTTAKKAAKRTAPQSAKKATKKAAKKVAGTVTKKVTKKITRKVTKK